MIRQIFTTVRVFVAKHFEQQPLLIQGWMKRVGKYGDFVPQCSFVASSHALIPLLCLILAPAARASSFSDNSTTGLSTNWLTVGSRGWSESNGSILPQDGSGSIGFLIHQGSVAANGTLTANLVADQWNGQNAGVVFRYTDPSNFYYIGVLPGNIYGQHIYFCKDGFSSCSYLGGINFNLSGTISLSIGMNGSQFSISLNGNLVTSINDASHASGQVGYAHTTYWNSICSFQSMNWAETSSESSSPVPSSSLVSSSSMVTSSTAASSSVVVSSSSQVILSPAITPSVASATTHSRNYQFSFERGNLLPNWSFEDDLDGWSPPSYGGSTKLSRAHLPSKLVPVSGSFVGAVDVGQLEPTYSYSALRSDLVRVDAQTPYVVSFFYAAPNLVGNAQVNIIETVGVTETSQTVTLTPLLSSKSGWSLYSASFTPDAGVTQIQVDLGAPKASGASGMIYFDDVVLEPGTQATPRSNVREAISFVDSKGRSTQMMTRLTQGVSGTDVAPVQCLEGIPYYATQNLVLPNDESFSGTASAGASVTLGAHSVFNGNLYSGGSVTLYDQSTINGNLQYQTTLTEQSGIAISGALTKANYTVCSLPSVTVNVGSTDIYLNPETVTTIAPGQYKNVQIGDRSKITLTSGTYNFSQFQVGTDVKISVSATTGPVTILVDQALSFSNSDTLIVLDGSVTNLVRIQYAGTNQVRFGCDDKIYSAEILAPNATVDLANRALVQGRVWAQNITVEAQAMMSAIDFFGVQSQSKWTIAGIQEYDLHDRPTNSYLPAVVSLDQPGVLSSDPTAFSNVQNVSTAYYNGNDAPNADGFAFSTKVYGQDNSNGVNGVIPAGRTWRNSITQGGVSFVSDLNIPTSLPLAPTANRSSDARYTLSFGWDVDNHYALTWTDRSGNVVKKAVNKNMVVGSDQTNMLSSSDWVITTYDYYPDGTMRASTSPEGIVAANVRDSRGNVMSSYDPDRGVRSAWYDQLGALRVSQNDEQRLNARASFVEHDSQNRTTYNCLISTQNLSGDNPLQVLADNADNNTCASIGGLVISGIAYDTSANIPASVGIPQGVTFANSLGRVVARWSTNSELPAFLSGSVNGHVIDYFHHDSLGRNDLSWRYTPDIPGAMALTKLSEVYDPLTNRILTENFWSVNPITGVQTIQEARNFAYDEFGRERAITDNDGKPVSSYTWNDLGNMRSAQVGGLENVCMGYDMKGVSAINASMINGGNTLYNESILHTVALAGDNGIATPATMADNSGRIKRVISNSGDENTSVTDFGYDQLSRLSAVRKYTNATLSSSEDWQNEDDGGVLAVTRDGIAHSYFYLVGSHLLDHVSGVMPSGRDLSNGVTMEYDLTGNLVSDKSLGLVYDYNSSGKQVNAYKDQALGSSGKNYEATIYDFSGQRVGSLSGVYGGAAPPASQWYVFLDGMLRAEVRSKGNGSAPAVVTDLQGAGGIVGRRHPALGKEWFVKDYQGSVVRTVMENGTDAYQYAFATYGLRSDLVKSLIPEPTLQWTGKELDTLTGNYYFGARFLDPELGVWLGADPAGQFANPFAFGDPINFVDLYGLWKIGIGITIGYDSKGGWNVGAGAALDVGGDGMGLDFDVGVSKSLRNGSYTYTAAVGGSVDIGVLSVSGKVAGSYNTTSGYTASLEAGAGVMGVGIEAGTTQYWNEGGDYEGGTAYGGEYAGAYGARVEVGDEVGWGKTGRRVARGNFITAGAYGLNVSYAENGGLSYGGKVDAANISYDSDNGFDYNYAGKEHIDKLVDAYQKAEFASMMDQSVACPMCVAIFAPEIVSVVTSTLSFWAAAEGLDQIFKSKDDREIKNAEKEFRTNTDFRRWFHREYKPNNKEPNNDRNNPDLSGDELRRAWEQFNGRSGW